MPATATATDSASIPLTAVAFTGQGLTRPECVLATRAGALFTADWRGGVAMIAADGTQQLFTGRLPAGRPLRPNGIALRRDGSFLLAEQSFGKEHPSTKSIRTRIADLS